jgi:N-acetyltransferase
MILPQDFFSSTFILQTAWARLEPLEPMHHDKLLPIAMHRMLWEFTSNKVYTAADYALYFNNALQEKSTQRSYPFAIFDKQLNQYAGCTRLGNIDLKNKRLEIGWTWIAPYLHGTGFNRHCKYLLLQLAFEQLQLNRVELKTSSKNIRSQKAMLNIGAVKEGVFRRHSINDDGEVRDSVFFSFIKEDWQATRQRYFTLKGIGDDTNEERDH